MIKDVFTLARMKQVELRPGNVNELAAMINFESEILALIDEKQKSLAAKKEQEPVKK